MAAAVAAPVKVEPEREEGAETLREALDAAMVRRTALEDEAEAIASELEAPGPEGASKAGITGPLVDREGFPRADIDVYRVTHQRHRLACIKTDHKALTKQIERYLHRVHATLAEGDTETKAVADMESADAVNDSPRPVDAAAPSSGKSAPWAPAWYKPFAEIDEVADGGPAALAGLRVGDEVLRFGSCTQEQFRAGTGLQPVVDVVQSHVGKEVRVVVIRNCARTLVKLVPHTWEGRGVLGCHLMPSRGGITEWPASYRPAQPH